MNWVERKVMMVMMMVMVMVMMMVMVMVMVMVMIPYMRRAIISWKVSFFSSISFSLPAGCFSCD